VQALKGLVSLTRLDLAGNRIGDEGAQALKGLVNLTSLNLAGNRIGAGGTQALKGLVNLTSLNLAGNRIGSNCATRQAPANQRYQEMAIAAANHMGLGYSE
jgi:Leucine-rich repeat (LRR) protein